MKRTIAPQYELPGAQDAFNLAGQVIREPESIEVAPAPSSAQGDPLPFEVKPQPDNEDLQDLIRNHPELRGQP